MAFTQLQPITILAAYREVRLNRAQILATRLRLHMFNDWLLGPSQTIMAYPIALVICRLRFLPLCSRSVSSFSYTTDFFHRLVSLERTSATVHRPTFFDCVKRSGVIDTAAISARRRFHNEAGAANTRLTMIINIRIASCTAIAQTAASNNSSCDLGSFTISSWPRLSSAQRSLVS